MPNELPDFLIVGAMKSGTSALRHYLQQHPNVEIPSSEIHFFDNDANYAQGLEWYSRFFERSHADKVVGEKTPTYGYADKCASRIRESLPDVKLIWILRDPVYRAYSNYWHAVLKGSESRSFSAAVNAEIGGQQPTSEWHSYVRRSWYLTEITRFRRLFPADHMCFLFLEELEDSPLQELERVHRFLGVAPHAPQHLDRQHVTKVGRSVALHRVLKRLSEKGIFPKLTRKAKRLNRQNAAGYPPMEETTRAALARHFASHNADLFSLIGRSTDKWIQPATVPRGGEE